MTRQVRISVGSEVYLKEELADNTKVATIYEVVEESVDREGNYEYYIRDIDAGWNDEVDSIGPYYPESLVDVEEAKTNDTVLINGIPHEKKSAELLWPKFKSYGLTREQVWEVMNNYANYMIDLLHDLEYEAISDGNEEFAKSYSDDKRVFYDLKLMSDRLWHRFVEGD